MIERILTAIVIVLMDWLEKRRETAKTIMAADRADAAMLRIRERLRSYEAGAYKGR